MFSVVVLSRRLMLVMALSCGSRSGEKDVKSSSRGEEEPSEAPSDEASTASEDDESPEISPSVDLSEIPVGDGVLLFGIGVHIEPFGAGRSASSSREGSGGEGGRGAKGGAGGKGGKSGRGGRGGKRGAKDYNDSVLFDRHVGQIDGVARMVEGHGGRLTIQGQDPFISVCQQSDCSLFSSLASRGHEIGLHFHEDAHLGKECESLSSATWCSEMKEQMGVLSSLSGTPIRYMSGGGVYSGLVEAAECANIDVIGEWKSRFTQEIAAELIGVHPWRPSDGPTQDDLLRFTTHDASGPVVFLPPGAYRNLGDGGRDRKKGPDGEARLFEDLAGSLSDSVAASTSDRVSVFHITIHAGEFGTREGTFPGLDTFLTDVVDPLVASGKIRWATYSEMGDAYRAWEEAGLETLDTPRGSEGG